VKKLLLLLLLFLLYSGVAFASQCSIVEQYAKNSGDKIFGKGFPHWYLVGQAKQESNCRWVSSSDGWGSVGWFQLTPKMLNPALRPVFPQYDKMGEQHVMAAVYYLKILQRSNPSKRLWVTFQMYNGGGTVVNECRRAGHWKWENCLGQCRRGNVCVWKSGGVCREYRSACDINYEYSLKVWKYGLGYKPVGAGDGNYLFW
jgi:hypothetical protein